MPDADSRSKPADPARALPADVYERDGWTVLHLKEASLMDPSVIEALGTHVEQLLAQGCKRLMIDFQMVQYISSSMVGVLVGARQSVDKAGGKLVLCGLHPRLHELLKLTRLEKMFTVEPDVATALEHLGS